LRAPSSAFGRSSRSSSAPLDDDVSFDDPDPPDARAVVRPIAHRPRAAHLDAIDATDTESPSTTRRVDLGTARRPLAPRASSPRRRTRLARDDNVDAIVVVVIARAMTMMTIASARWGARPSVVETRLDFDD
jgi:hypothetical protein